MVFTGIIKIIEVAGVVQVPEGCAIAEADHIFRRRVSYSLQLIFQRFLVRLFGLGMQRYGQAIPGIDNNDRHIRS